MRATLAAALAYTARKERHRHLSTASDGPPRVPGPLRARYALMKGHTCCACVHGKEERHRHLSTASDGPPRVPGPLRARYALMKDHTSCACVHGKEREAQAPVYSLRRATTRPRPAAHKICAHEGPQLLRMRTRQGKRGTGTCLQPQTGHHASQALCAQDMRS